jgi:peptidoglycan/xylan/chitin deacetylase (PgdA/CDA1 family)
MRALARYWFVAALLAAVVVLQFAVGFLMADSAADSDHSSAMIVGDRRSTVTLISTRLSGPTFTPRSTATLPPTSSPTPTPTVEFVDTPAATVSVTPSPSVSPTPTSIFTPVPQPTPLGEGLAKTVPILMYHYLSTPPSDADAIRRDLSVDPDQFEAHLAYLRQAGYETISFNQLILALSRDTDLPPKPVVITFDDGYRDNYENAFPLLRQYGYTATFFIFTQPIDHDSPNYLSWAMVTEMHKAGMEFGSHSYRHPDLSGRDVDFLVYEILGSKEAIEERTGEPVRFFAYPAGRYDELTIRVLASAHYWGAVTTQWGAEQSYDERFEMLRIRVRGNDTADDLADKLVLFEE